MKNFLQEEFLVVKDIVKQNLDLDPFENLVTNSNHSDYMNDNVTLVII